jgi:DNA-binding MarR family transcriptional regulator
MAVRADTPVDERAELGARLRIAVARLARRLRQEAGTDLSPSLMSMLSTVDRHGPLTPSELSEREQIRRPTTTRLIARLEQQGLLATEIDLADRRSYRVAVTPRGARLLEQARRRKSAFLTSALGELDARELDELERGLELLERLTVERS